MVRQKNYIISLVNHSLSIPRGWVLSCMWSKWHYKNWTTDSKLVWSTWSYYRVMHESLLLAIIQSIMFEKHMHAPSISFKKQFFWSPCMKFTYCIIFGPQIKWKNNSVSTPNRIARPRMHQPMIILLIIIIDSTLKLKADWAIRRPCLMPIDKLNS